MSKLDGLIKEIRELKPDDYVRLQKRLLRHEQQLWDSELTQASERMDTDRITDSDIDQFVMRRRRESRR